MTYLLNSSIVLPWKHNNFNFLSFEENAVDMENTVDLHWKDEVRFSPEIGSDRSRLAEDFFVTELGT